MKTFHIMCEDKEISKHNNFYLAQEAVEHHLRNGRMNNNYDILPIEFWYREDYENSWKK